MNKAGSMEELLKELVGALRFQSRAMLAAGVLANPKLCVAPAEDVADLVDDIVAGLEESSG